MRYKILKRILEGQKTIGYQLIGEDKKIYNVAKDQVIHAARQGCIINANYNKSVCGISGVGIDLRVIPSIQFSEISNKSSGTKTKNKQTNKSNRELAEDFLDKQNKSGIQIFDIRIISEDEIQLIKVNDVYGVSKIDIPEFITSYAYLDKDNNTRLEFNIDKKQVELHSGTDVTVVTKDMINRSKYIREVLKDALMNYSNTDKLTRISNIVYSNPILNICDINKFVCCMENGDSSINTEYSGEELRFIVDRAIKLSDRDPDISLDTDLTDGVYGPFYNTSYTEVEVKAQFDRYDMLFSGIKSNSFRVTVKNPVSVMSCRGIFKGCVNLERLETSGLRLNGNMEKAFYMCKMLEEIDFNNLGIKGKTVKGNQMFYGCEKLKNFDMSYNNLVLNKSFIGKCSSLKMDTIEVDLGQLNITSLIDSFTDTAVNKVIVIVGNRVRLLNTFRGARINEIHFINKKDSISSISSMINAFADGRFGVIDFGEVKCNLSMCTALNAFKNTVADILDIRNFVYHTRNAEINTNFDSLDSTYTYGIEYIFRQMGKTDSSIKTIITRSIQFAAEYLMICEDYTKCSSEHEYFNRNSVIVIGNDTHESCRDILDSISGNIGYDFVKCCGKTYTRRASRSARGIYDINIEDGIIGDCSPLNAAYQWYGISKNTIIEAYLAGGDALDYTINIHGLVGDAYGLCSNICIDTYYFEFEDDGEDLNNLYINIDNPSSIKSAVGLVQLVISDEGEFKSTDTIAENIINRVHIDYDKLSHLGTKEELIRAGIIQIIGLIDVGNREKGVVIYNVYGERLHIDEGIIHTVYDTYENIINSADYEG